MSTTILAAIAAVGALMQAGQTVSAARAKKEQYNAQARQKRLEGRVDALNYKRQGIEVLKESQRVMAANVARGAAGGINPFESGGSVALVNAYAMRGAANDFSIARDNAGLAQQMAQEQAYQYELAGYNTVKGAKRSAMAGVLTTAATLGATGYNPSGSLGPYTGSATGIGGGSGATVM